MGEVKITVSVSLLDYERLEVLSAKKDLAVDQLVEDIVANYLDSRL